MDKATVRSAKLQMHLYVLVYVISSEYSTSELARYLCNQTVGL